MKTDKVDLMDSQIEFLRQRWASDLELQAMYNGNFGAYLAHKKAALGDNHRNVQPVVKQHCF